MPSTARAKPSVWILPTMPPKCVACLDTKRCAICEGTGNMYVGSPTQRRCAKCDGNGVCTYCAPATSIHPQE